ncbi:MAG: phage tail protein [Candidatus Acidiferrales bacterium]
MGFFATLFAYVATTVVSALLTPHPKIRASALGNFTLPTAKEGRPIPVVFGTVMLKGGNTVWWGDLKTHAYKANATVSLVVGDVITVATAVLLGVAEGLSAGMVSLLGGIAAGSGLFSFFSRPDIGFQYFLGVQFCLCHGPVDALVGIQANVQNLSYTATTIENGNGSENYIQLAVNSPNLFGGTAPGGGGGIVGEIRFYRGLATQQPDDYLAAKQNRVATDQEGIGYTFSGHGNGSLDDLEAGAASKTETVQVICNGVNTNIDDPNGHYNKAYWKVVGSISGTVTNTSSGDAGGCWSDTAYTGSPDILDFTIDTGDVQFAAGDTFTVETLHSTLTPSYAGICQAVFKQLYLGTTSYLKPLAFIVQRCPDGLGLGSSVSNINSGDANAAEMIYDLLTSTVYGMSIPAARVDAAGTFKTAAETLASEGLGLSMVFDQQETADDIISEILRHIDGVLYTDPATGLWSLVLVRPDYTVSDLPVCDVDNVLETVDYSRASWEETTNLVRASFTSRANNFDERVVGEYDPANISITQEVRPQTIDYPGVTSEAAAELVATRALRSLTYPVAKIKIVVNRAGWQLRPGGVFVLTWVPLGISQQVFRITRIAYGKLTDGRVTIEAVEDIYGLNYSTFQAAPLSGWVNPLGAPSAPAAQQLMEAPYQMIAAAGIGEGIYALALCARGDGTDRDFETWLDEGNGYFLGNTIFGFSPIGNLSAEYSAGTPATDSTGFTLELAGQVDLNFLSSVTAADLPNGANLLLIDDEIMSWETITANADGTYTVTGVMRGVMDTVPADHAAGATAWFFSFGCGLAKTMPYAEDTTVTAKFLPQNAYGTFPITSATELTLGTSSRYARPYPPGNLRMQGAGYGTRYSEVTGDLALTWSSRNRLTQTAGGTLIAQDAADIAGESGQTFTVKASIDGTVVRTETGISGESFAYTGAMRAADGSDGTKAVTLAISSNANSLDSFQANALATTMTGFGFDFGEAFGGIEQ